MAWRLNVFDKIELNGFVALEDSEIIYKCIEEYDPSLDRGIIWNDPKIGIEWTVKEPILSEKDARLPNLKDAENNFVFESNDF